LSDFVKKEFASSSLETIQVNINSYFNPSQIDWLIGLIINHIGANPDMKAGLTFSPDSNSSIISLEDIFAWADGKLSLQGLICPA